MLLWSLAPTPHTDPLRRDWLTHQHRDTLSSIVGHPTLTSYLAIADGEAMGRVRFEMTEVSLTRHLHVVQPMNVRC